MESTQSEIARLAPPGAGIPAIERLVGGAIFAIRRWSGTRERFAQEFASERGLIAGLYRGHADEVLRERVLIRRLRGIEDSSRYWSVWMTLEHLRIVNHQIARVIELLTQGHVPPGQASTASVKPSPDVGSEVVQAYEAACDRFVERVAACAELKTAVRYAHPWFGPLDAAGWQAMAAMHMRIHRAQISAILARQAGRRP